MNRELAQLEALLFASGAPMAKKQIMSIMRCDKDKLDELLEELNNTRKEAGVVVTTTDSHVALTTNPAHGDFLGQVKKEEETTPLSKAAQETLAIILYAGPITKVDLDFLRGVNTQYTLRRLAMRGLIQEKRKKHDRLLSPTIEILLHLGVKKPEELPDYKEIRQTVLSGVQDIKEKMKEQNT